MYHSHLDYFQKPPLGGRSNQKKPGDHDTPNVHNRWFILFYHVCRPAWIEIHCNIIWLRTPSHMTSHYTWESVTTPTWFWKVYWDGLWTLSFGLSQSHGHGSWVMCEVILNLPSYYYPKASIYEPQFCTKKIKIKNKMAGSPSSKQKVANIIQIWCGTMQAMQTGPKVKGHNMDIQITGPGNASRDFLG